jgi:AcrR family transcriptional regulator
LALNNSKKEIVEKNIEQIREWIGQGVPMGTIAKAIGVSKTTLYKHVADLDSGLTSLDAIKKYREPAVDKIESTMFTSACGYERKVKKYAKVRRTIYENGKKSEEWEEMVEYEETIYYPPDTTAGIFLLKNWADYANEPRAMEYRKEELELKRKQVESNLW